MNALCILSSQEYRFRGAAVCRRLLLFITVLTSASGFAQQLGKLESCLPIPSLQTDLHQTDRPVPPPDPVYIEQVEFRTGSDVPIEAQKRILRDLQAREFDRTNRDMAEEVARFSLMDLGFFKAFIEDPVEITEIPGRKGRYRIVLKAQTGQQYQLKEILFANAKGVDNSTLRSLFRIKDGDLFNRTAIGEGLDRMRKLYGARGYVNFTSVPQTAVDEEDASVAIAIDIDTGPVYRFTSLKFLGVNEADSTKLESVLPLKEGEIFSAELFEQTIRTVESQLSRVGEGHDVRLLPNDKDHTVSIEIRSWPCPFRK